MPISFLMDRTKPGPTATQGGFFEFIAIPLFQTFVRGVPVAQPLLAAVLANCQQWKKQKELEVKPGS